MGQTLRRVPITRRSNRVSNEKMGMKQYTQTTLKGKEIIEFFVNELKQEGITHVDR